MDSVLSDGKNLHEMVLNNAALLRLAGTRYVRSSPGPARPVPVGGRQQSSAPSERDKSAFPSCHLAAGGRNKSHKIRRFGCLDELLVPVNLLARLASRPADTEDHRCVRDEPDADGLLALLADAVSAGVDAVSERLLLDFFVEVKTERRSRQHVAARDGLLQRRKAERLGNVVAAARGWLLDGAGWGLHDVLRGGAAVTAEMETEMHVGEEEREVGTVVAGVLTEQLVDEVVKDLLVL